MCFLFALTIPAELCSAKTNSITAQSTTINKVPKLKTGTNKIIVPITYPDEEKVYNTKFVAPKSGKYRIKIYGIRSAITEYPTVCVRARKAESVKSTYSEYKYTDISGRLYPKAVKFDTTYMLFYYNCVDEVNKDIDLNKDNVLLFSSYETYGMSPRAQTLFQIRENGKMSYKIKIELIEEKGEEKEE